MELVRNTDHPLQWWHGLKQFRAGERSGTKERAEAAQEHVTTPELNLLDLVNGNPQPNSFRDGEGHRAHMASRGQEAHAHGRGHPERHP
jgi:hypothetical protein